MADPIAWTNGKRKLSELKEWADNPRLILEHDAHHLDKSLARFNLADPLIVNLDNTLNGGHQRRRRLLEMYGAEYEVDIRVPSRESAGRMI